MTIRMPSRAGAWMAALAFSAILPACGGGGGGSNTPSTLPPAPPQPTRTQIGSNSFAVSGFPDVATTTFQLTAGGTIEIVADWTFASSDIDILWYAGTCTALQASRGECSILARTTSETQKPERLTIANVGAGTYTIGFANYANRSESGNFQVFLTR